MCFQSAPPKDNSAEIARQAEIERQQKITQGRQAIDQTFAAFDPSYYEGLQKDYLGYYNPQIDEQYSDAKKSLVFNLARSGNLNASTGAAALGDLTKSYERNRALIGDQAASTVQQQQATVDQNKNELYNQLGASADPAAAASTATARASALTAPASYSPLGNLFASILNSTATGVTAEKQGYPGFQTGLFSPSKSGSVSVVN